MSYFYISEKSVIYGYKLWKPPADDPLLIQLLFWKPENPSEYYIHFLNKWEKYALGLYEDRHPFWQETAWIDIDKKIIFLCSNKAWSNRNPFRKICIWLLKQNWPGWHIKWLDQGIKELWELIGYQSQFEEQDFDRFELWHSILECFSPLDERSKSKVQEILECLDDVNEKPSCIITLKTDKFVKDYGFSILSGQIFTLGPHIIPKLYHSRSIAQIKETTESYPDSGIYIDQPRSCVYFWIDQCVDPLIVQEMEKIWRGWRVFWHTQGLPYHYALSGRNPVATMLPFTEMELWLRQWFDTPSVCFPLDPTEPDEVANPEKLNRLIQELQTRYEDLWK